MVSVFFHSRTNIFRLYVVVPDKLCVVAKATCKLVSLSITRVLHLVCLEVFLTGCLLLAYYVNVNGSRVN